MNLGRSQGQGLVETTLLLPAVLLLLYGTFACLRAYFLDSAAESAAHAEAIRSGRQLAGMERQMSDSILPEGKGVRIYADAGTKTKLLPAPFPGLTGRTKGIAEVQNDWEETFAMANLPPLHTGRISEMSVDCWEKRSPSGKNIRRVVSGIVVTGILR
jgi:hypothetical protein